MFCRLVADDEMRMGWPVPLVMVNSKLTDVAGEPDEVSMVDGAPERMLFARPEAISRQEPRVEAVGAAMVLAAVVV